MATFTYTLDRPTVTCHRQNLLELEVIVSFIVEMAEGGATCLL